MGGPTRTTWRKLECAIIGGMGAGHAGQIQTMESSLRPQLPNWNPLKSPTHRSSKIVRIKKKLSELYFYYVRVYPEFISPLQSFLPYPGKKSI